eukprot:m.265528 g.265528  ORF g.265528 m.265528 type:complete len:454 (+) comp29756_c0_seq1:96-1457(+)
MDSTTGDCVPSHGLSDAAARDQVAHAQRALQAVCDSINQQAALAVQRTLERRDALLSAIHACASAAIADIESNRVRMLKTIAEEAALSAAGMTRNGVAEHALPASASTVLGPDTPLPPLTICAADIAMVAVCEDVEQAAAIAVGALRVSTADTRSLTLHLSESFDASSGALTLGIAVKAAIALQPAIASVIRVQVHEGDAAPVCIALNHVDGALQGSYVPTASRAAKTLTVSASLHGAPLGQSPQHIRMPSFKLDVTDRWGHPAIMDDVDYSTGHSLLRGSGCGLFLTVLKAAVPAKPEWVEDWAVDILEQRSPISLGVVTVRVGLNDYVETFDTPGCYVFAMNGTRAPFTGFSLNLPYVSFSAEEYQDGKLVAATPWSTTQGFQAGDVALFRLDAQAGQLWMCLPRLARRFAMGVVPGGQYRVLVALCESGNTLRVRACTESESSLLDGLPL